MSKVLVVEDDLSTRKVVAKIVESLAHSVIQASNGRVAQEILRDNPDISLVVSDMAMPDFNGRELISYIRRSELLKAIPIVVVSGVVGPNEISSLLEEGATRFLPKPVDSVILKDYVQRLLTQKE